MKAAYTTPKIVDYGGDLSRDWFVYFKYKHNGRWRKVVREAGINKHKTKAQRIKQATAIRDAIVIALKQGWTPFRDDGKERLSVVAAIDEVMRLKKGSLRVKSYRTYNDVASSFKSWLKDNGYSHLFPESISQVMARDYLDYLLTNKAYSGKSHNGQLGILKTIFNVLVEREVIIKNPWRGIREQPEHSVMNVPYTDNDKEKIIDYLKRYNIRMYYAVCFVYFCFIRRSELIRLKVRDINLKDCMITIPADVSKNGRSESVTIPRAFEGVLREMELYKYNAEDYVFGHKFQTCARKIARADSMSTAITRVNKELGITGNKGFYSFKHTGVVALYKATKDPYLVSRQCRHHSLQMTMIYLRSLGLTVADGIRSADFTF